MRLNHIFLLMAVLVLHSCSPVTPTLQTQDSEAGHPLTTTTGVLEVDRVLAAVASNDPRELQALVRYTAAPCTRADGLGGPPRCQEGETEGTMLEVLPFIASEGGHIRRSEIGNWQGIDANAVYAVYRVSGYALNEQYYPPGEYLVIFMPDEYGGYAALRVAEGGIVRVDTLMGVDTLQTVIDRDTAEAILPPETR